MMNFEVHNAEVVQRVVAHVRTGHFHDVDDVLVKALDALDQQTATAGQTGETGAVIVKALQSSPYREIELTHRLFFLPTYATSNSDGVAS